MPLAREGTISVYRSIDHLCLWQWHRCHPDWAKSGQEGMVYVLDENQIQFWDSLKLTLLVQRKASQLCPTRLLLASTSSSEGQGDIHTRWLTIRLSMVQTSHLSPMLTMPTLHILLQRSVPLPLESVSSCSSVFFIRSQVPPEPPKVPLSLCFWQLAFHLLLPAWLPC